MAKQQKGKKKKQQVKRRRSKGALCAVFAGILLLGGTFTWMWGGAHLTHLRYAQVYLENLPESFDGTTLLYISDINLQSKADANYCARLMKKLNNQNVDMLLLGGDYTTPSISEKLGGAEDDSSARAERFIAALADFSAPMGKFAVAGEQDRENELETMFTDSGVRLLRDRSVAIEKNGEKLIIAGLNDSSEKTTPYEKIGGYFSGDECVIVLAHNPASYIGIRVAEARGGGAWADLVLSGHTLGGQIRVGNRTIRTMPDEEARCLAGWYYTNDLPMLVSQGLGCKGAKLRLGSESEIWQITLKKPVNYTLPDF